MTDRSFVFLNHAIPEDNAFTAWLGARLAAAGYNVWSEILMLGGGETFWTDINEGIRRRSALFLPVLSSAAAQPEKRGVHNEITIAMQVQRRERWDGFVLPVLLEEVAEPNPELIQLNYVDFTKGWAAGLARLLERMEKLSVPRMDGPQTDGMRRWLAVQAHLSGAVHAVPSVLTSNWFAITVLPPVVRYLGTPAGKSAWEEALRRCRLPIRPHLRLAITFAGADEVQMEAGPAVPVRTEYEMPTQAFLDGKPPPGMPSLRGVDARRIAVDMLRQAWDTLASSRGLKSHQLSGGRTCWYVPEGLLPGDWGVFPDGKGGLGRRKMVGIRGKRRIRYHFAVSAKPQILPFPRLVIRSHVVFSEGGVLVTERRAALRNRKALCKSWWNAEWRDRQSGMLLHLAANEASFDLPLGRSAAKVSATPITFEASMTYSAHNDATRVEDEAEPDGFDDALDNTETADDPFDDDDGDES